MQTSYGDVAVLLYEMGMACADTTASAGGSAAVAESQQGQREPLAFTGIQLQHATFKTQRFNAIQHCNAARAWARISGNLDVHGEADHWTQQATACNRFPGDVKQPAQRPPSIPRPAGGEACHAVRTDALHAIGFGEVAPAGGLGLGAAAHKLVHVGDHRLLLLPHSVFAVGAQLEIHVAFLLKWTHE